MDTYTASTGSIALTASSDQTLLQIVAPSTLRGRLLSLSVSFNGTDATDAPALVQLVRQSNAGTGTSVTPVPVDADAPAALFTAAKDHSSQPTTTDVLGTWFVTPVGGLFVMSFGIEDGPVIDVSSRLALVANPADACNAAASMTFVQ